MSHEASVSAPAKSNRLVVAAVLGVLAIVALNAGACALSRKSTPAAEPADRRQPHASGSRQSGANGSDQFPAQNSTAADVADLLKQASALRSARRYTEAEILLARAVQTDEDSVAARLALAAVQRDMAIATVADLLKQASILRSAKRYREAEILLTRAVQTDIDTATVYRALAAVQRDMAIASIGAGDLLKAAQELDRADRSVKTLFSISVNPSAPSIDPKTVLDEEDANKKISQSVRAAIDKACSEHIDKATVCAVDADRSMNKFLLPVVAGPVSLVFFQVKNDRPTVVNGLKELKVVFELVPWASESTRTSALEALSKLKKLVNPEEWDELLARAGFDPSSRNNLKKWGLE